MDNILDIKIELHNKAIKGVLNSYKKYKFNIELFILSDNFNHIEKYIDKLSDKITLTNDISNLYENAYKFGYMCGKIFYIKNE